ncbi:MAG: hypothetical protein AB1467_06490 [Candidatus Diapherotrites archaeon]
MEVKEPEFKRVKLDLAFFLKVLIIANFLIIFSVLFLHPIPEYLLVTDTITHIKWIELIKKDFKYIDYNHFGSYPKGFHLINAALSFLLPVGTAMALSTAIFGALLIVFSYKLAFLVSKNKTQALTTAFITSTISVGVTSSISSAIPQTFALALMVMTAYFFLKKDWIKGGITLGIYSTIHTSFPLVIGLILIIALIDLFKRNNTENLFVLIKMIALMLAFFLPLVLFQNYYKMQPAVILDSLPRIQFYDDMISPLSLLSVTSPFGIILLAFIGLYFYKKNISEQKFQLMILWFLIPLALSQAYWLTDSGLVLWIFPASRILIFFLFPVAFFSSKTIMMLKRKEIIFAVVSIIFLISVSNSFSLYQQKPAIDKYDFELIEHLKKDGKIDKIIAGDYGAQVIQLSLNKGVSDRDLWLIFGGYLKTLIDENRVDFVLLYKKKYSKGYEVKRGVTKDFENKKWILLKIGKELKFQKPENLNLYLISFITFLNSKYEKIAINNPYFIAVIAEDSKDITCMKMLEGISIESCPKEVDFIIKGEKKNIIELFNSYDKDYFKLKLLYMYRKKMLNFSSPLNPFLKLENAEYLSHIKRWTSTSPYSQPNENIARVFWALGLR